MKSKAIGVIIAFTALAVALNFVRIPVPYMPTFNYQMGEIILVIAFLLFGIKIGFIVAAFNMLVTMAVFNSPSGLIGAPYYLVAVLTMIVGIYLYEKSIKHRIQTKQHHTVKSTTLSTTFGVLTRTLIMLPLDYFAYGFLVSLVSGLSISTAYALILASMPGIILYNITVPLYVIPISYYIANKVSKQLDSSLFKNGLV